MNALLFSRLKKYRGGRMGERRYFRRVCFRADGNHAIGMGHLARSLVLASEFGRRGYAVEFHTRTPGALLARQTVSPRVTLIRISSNQRWEDELPGLAPKGPASGADAPVLYLVDGRQFTAEYLRRLRAWGVVAVIDDRGGPLEADLVINHHLAAATYRYPGVSLRLVGPGYALLRADFFRARSRPPHPAAARLANRILICFGGADPENLSRRVAAVLAPAALARGWQLRIILGPAYGPADRLGLPERSRGLRVVCDPPSMAAQMRWADVGVLSAGGIMLEALAAGLPTIALTAAPDQVEPLRAAAAAGLVLQVTGQRHGGKRLLAAVQQLLQDGSRRRQLRRQGQRLLDGRGASRVVSAIEHWTRTRPAAHASGIPL